MQFDGLACLTGLRVLSLSPLVLPDADKQLQEQSAIAEALPRLQRLTWLRLRGPAATDTVLRSIKDLMGLRHLVLRDACCSEDLPAALHHLMLCCRVPTPDPAAGLNISPHSRPGFCMLKSLETLHLEIVDRFDTSVLGNMPQLGALYISSTPLTAPPGQYRFQASTQGLPELTQLWLHQEDLPFDLIAPLTPEEAAALTASTSLEMLVLSDDYMSMAPESWCAMFPPGRQLRVLSSLKAGTGLLLNPVAMQQMTARCQQLTALAFNCCPELQEDAVDPGMVAASLQHLTRIPNLQRLTLVHHDLPLGSIVVNALAALTHLTNLELEYGGTIWRQLPDAVVRLARTMLSDQPTSHEAMQCLVRTEADVHEFEAGQQQKEG